MCKASCVRESYLNGCASVTVTRVIIASPAVLSFICITTGANTRGFAAKNYSKSASWVNAHWNVAPAF